MGFYRLVICSAFPELVTAYSAVQNRTAKPNTDGVTHAPFSIPTMCLIGVISIDRRDVTKDICPVMVKKSFG